MPDPTQEQRIRSNLAAGYINLTDQEKLYALRCIADTPIQDCGTHGVHLGLSQRALKSLIQDGLLRVAGEDSGFPICRLTNEGMALMELKGGRFKHG